MASSATSIAPDHVSPERVFTFDMYQDPRLKQDLHASYAKLHELAPPVFYTPENGGHWMITRYDAIIEITTDTEHFSSAEMQIPRVANPPPRFIPLNYDPPENMPYRQILMPYFSPKAVKTMEAQINEQANAIVGAVAGKGRCDFLADVAGRFPVTVFMLLMGLPLERLDDFRRLAERFFVNRRTEDIGKVSAEIIGEMELILDQRRAEPKEDLVSFILAAEIQGRKLEQNELVNMCYLLFLAGLDTVSNVLTFITCYLADNPSLQRRLLDDPDCVANFVEEGLRMYGVVNVPRVVKKNVDKLGVKFRVGDMVLCTLPLAGRDDQKNPHPELFDIDRRNRQLLTFSIGAHLCLGHFLARAELKKLFTVWMEKIGEFRLVPNQTLSYRAGTVMALESLMVEWDVKQPT